jgi:glycosyltransferase involved in cell wall biosynthesis
MHIIRSNRTRQGDDRRERRHGPQVGACHGNVLQFPPTKALPLSQGKQASPRLPTVSIIIPVHRAGKHFLSCLEAIAKMSEPPDELIVVADGEPEETCRLAKTFGAVVLRTSTPRGPARARNLGAMRASGEILLFIDSDVRVKNDTVLRVKRFFASNPEYDAMIGSYDDDPGAPNFFSQYKNMTHHWVHQHARNEASTFWGACGAIRRGVFMDSNGFDGSFTRPSIEDIELGYRLKHSGHRIRLKKNIQVTHLKEWRVTTLLRSDLLDRAVPWTRLLLRQKSIPRDLNLNLANRLSTMLIFVAISMGLIGAGLGISSAWTPLLLIPAVLCLLLVILLNRGMYAFFLARKGAPFTAAAMMWHWFSFLYSGVAFLWCLAEHRLGSLASRLKRRGAIRNVSERING